MNSRQPVLRALFHVEGHEVGAVAWSFAYFFCLLACNYVLKPLRDAMGIQGGVRNLPWLYTGTFTATLIAVPLYSALVARCRRQVLVRVVYEFFTVNLVLFWLLLSRTPDSTVLGVHIQLDATTQVYVARTFFIWTSVFNVFVVSLFWSVQADVFGPAQGKRLFGLIAAGGTLGGVLGSAATSQLAERWGAVNLLWIPVFLLQAAILCASRLRATAPAASGPRAETVDAPTGGGIWNGILLVFRSPYLRAIAGYLLILTLSSTFLSLSQNAIYDAASSDRDVHTRWFANVNFWTQVLTLVVQSLVAARLVAWLGIGITLAIPAVLSMAGFSLLGLSPGLTAVSVFAVLASASRYAVYTPAREVLFTVVSREEKYKSKGFIDTVVYRGGDVASAWIYKSLGTLGLTLAQCCFAVVPVGVGWIVLSLFLGRRQHQRAAGQATPAPAARRT